MLADTTHELARWWAPALAFAAGTVSFASPCVFPLVPGYLSFLTAERAVQESVHESVQESVQEDETARGRRQVMPILLFIVGFALVFTMLGAASSTWVPLLKGTLGRE